MSNGDEMKAVARRWYTEILGGGNLDLVEDLFIPEFIEHSPLNPLPGLDGVRHLVTGFRTAFPDLTVTIEDMVADGDKLAVRFTGRGTHQGPFAGLPPTGRPGQIGCMDILRFAQGRIAEHWGEADMLGLLQQLGAIPAPGA